MPACHPPRSLCCTSNPVEATFATVRLRKKVTKGPGSRAAGLAMAFKLLEAAKTVGARSTPPHLVAFLRTGATFRDGELIENHTTDQETAASPPAPAHPQVLWTPHATTGDSTTGLLYRRSDRLLVLLHIFSKLLVGAGRCAVPRPPAPLHCRAGGQRLSAATWAHGHSTLG